MHKLQSDTLAAMINEMREAQEMALTALRRGHLAYLNASMIVCMPDGWQRETALHMDTSSASIPADVLRTYKH